MTVLKHEVDTEGHTAIPENLRGFYAPVDGEDGKFSIPEAMRPMADAMTGLFAANTKIRDENKKLAKSGTPDLSALADFGEDLPTIAEAVTAKIAELETAAAAGEEGKLNVDKVRTQMKEAHAKELAKKDEENGALRGTVHKYLVTSTASSALAEEGGNVELAMPFVEKMAKVIEQDGEFTTVVVDKDGDPRISGGTGQPMTIKELVREMKSSDTYAPLFKSETKGGGGAKPGQPKAPANPGKGDASPIDKIKAGLASRAA